MNRYICIHGHFYQPPRENPWLEEVELQDSAYPYHDWNERITAKCYAPNTASWKDAITAQVIKGQGTLLIGEVLKHFPVTLLVSKEEK